MIKFDGYRNENKTEYNSKWPYIPDHPCRILIIGAFWIWNNKCIIGFNKEPAGY